MAMNCSASLRLAMRILSGILVLSLFGGSFCLAAPPQIVSSLHVNASGPMETVFDWSRMRCEDWDVPDVPMRAWRGADRQVHAIASHFRNRVMTGPTLNKLQHACSVVFKGDNDDAPAMNDDRSWIASTYSVDGSTVFALVHNEFQGNSRPALCPSARYMSCWRNSITLAISRNDGQTFTHTQPPDHYVAGVPYRYEGDVGHPTGYFSPSNIIEKDGFYYAFFWAEETGAAPRRVPDAHERSRRPDLMARMGRGFLLGFFHRSRHRPGRQDRELACLRSHRGRPFEQLRRQRDKARSHGPLCRPDGDHAAIP